MQTDRSVIEPSFIYSTTDRRLVQADGQVTGLLGIDPAGLKPRQLLELVLVEDRGYVIKNIKKVLSGELIPSFDFRIQGSPDPVWLRLAPQLVMQNGAPVIRGIVADVSREVSNMLTVQKYANKKNSVLTILAHDLRGPLGIADLLTVMLQKEESCKGAAGPLSDISRLIRQSLNLVNNLIEREFLDSAGSARAYKRIDLAAKLNEYFDEYRNSDWSGQRTFSFSSSADSIYLPLDEIKFMQVPNNLMSNALKFTRPGDHIRASLVDLEDRVLFSFSDTGIGIPASMLDKLFDPYTEARRPGLMGEPATGLGLSIVKTIVGWQGGRVWVDSEEGKGSTFYIELPK